MGIKSPSLEHLTDPLGGLPCLKRVVKEGGSITVVGGVREKAVALGLVDAPAWEKGIADLYRTAGDDGTFCYTFFKGVGRK